MSLKPKSHTDQIERNRKKLVALCSAIEREALTMATNHSTATDGLKNEGGQNSGNKRIARVLVIDDSKFARGVAKGFLEAAGHFVEEASDGNEGLERFSLGRHDLVVTDIVMEGLSGLEVLDRILTMEPSANVIIASSNIQLMTRREALERGAVALLTKPLNGAQLNKIIAAMIALEP